jgi:uncharacterized protein YggE
MRTITVIGHGVAQAVPDVAVVQLAATHLARTLPEALSGAESARAAIVATAGRFTDQIGSQGLSVGAEWNDAGRQDRYRARHALLIRCTDLDQAGELVSALADEIGERISVDHVGLEVGDPSDATRLAREAAFADARATGEHLAAQAGGALGQVESIAEGGSASGAGRVTALAASSKVHFEAGQTAVQQTLTVTFELL